MTVGIPSFTSTITVRKNCIFGKQILSILTPDVVYTCPSSFVYSDASALVVVLLLASIKSTCVIECGRILRAYRAPLGGSFVPLNFLCNLLLLSLRDRLITDNQAAARIGEVGSMKIELHRMARRIFDICVQSGIYLDMQWIPRTLNQQADYISRLIDVDDWQTTNDLFLALNHRWGPHSVDCFANYYNHKLPRFFPKFWNPNTAGVDFFIQPLRGENCSVVPPASIVPVVLHYMKSQNAVGTVILPFWPSAHYWPLLTNKYLKYISGYSMHIGNQSLAHGRNLNSLLGSKRFKGYVIALRMEFLD